MKLGKFIVAFWMLTPPVIFWIDWVCFCRHLTVKEKNVAKHSHDLSRNVWLALVGVLVVAFKLGMPGQ